jgi:hypothetical protein
MATTVIDPNGNLVLILTNDEGVHRFIVRSTVLIQSSKYWESLLTGAFMEGGQNQINIHDDPRQALNLMLQCIHGAFDAFPPGTTYTELIDLATLCDKYDVGNTVRPFAEAYLGPQEGNLCSPGNEEWGLQMLFHLKCADMFDRWAKRLVQKVTVDNNDRCVLPNGEALEVDRPANLPECILSGRRNLITSLLLTAQGMVEPILTTSECVTRPANAQFDHYRNACRNMSLGTMLGGMTHLGIPYRRPSDAVDNISSSADAVYRSLARVVFPNYHDDIGGAITTHDQCNLGPEWRTRLQSVFDNVPSPPLTAKHHEHF